jgi:hypothetical protein
MQFLIEEHENPAFLSGGGSSTYIACDTCGEKIQGQQDGIAVFHKDAQNVKDGKISVIHKGRCDTAETKRLPWDDLELFLREVVLNAQIDLRKAENRVSGTDGLASMGLNS